MAEAKHTKEYKFNVELYEKKEGKLGKITELCLDAGNNLDQPLQETLNDLLANEWPDINLVNVKCLSGNIRGSYINLQQKPTEIPYINNSFSKKQTPTLIVLRESTSSPPPPLSPDIMEPQKVGRTLSNFLRTMIGSIHDPAPLDLNTTLEQIGENVPNVKVTNPSSSSSGDNSPNRINIPRGGKFNKTNRSVSMKNPLYVAPPDTSANVEEDEVFDPLSASLPRTSKIINGNAKKSFKSRKSMFVLSKSHEENEEEEQMDISGPEQKTFDFGTRKKQGVRTTRKGNENRPKRKESIPPELSYISFQVTTITIQPEESPPFDVSCREYETVGALKETVIKEMKRKSFMFSDSTNNKSMSSDIILTYSVDGTVYELFNDRQLIYKTLLYKTWEKHQATDIPVYITSKETNWELSTFLRISKLTGALLDEGVEYSFSPDQLSKMIRIAKNDRTEVEWTRRILHSFVDEVVRERDGIDYALSMELATDEVPTLLALQTPLDNKIEITFHFQDVFSLVRRVNVNTKVNLVLCDVFPCLVACGLVKDDVNLYTLQMSGEQSYLYGDNELIAFKDIRRCILKSEPIHLSVSKKPTVEEDETCKLNWLPIDPYSNEPPLHTDISKEKKDKAIHEVFAASVWDQTEEFALVVTQVNNLPIPTTKETKKIQVIVTAAIYHANHELIKKTETRAHLLTADGKIEFHETLMFEIQTKNLPKAAKILVTIQDHPHKDKNKHHNILYWGLVPVFDHRGILQTGPYTMTLWKGPTSNKLTFRETTSSDINPCAPCNNNPNPVAVQVIVQFPRYTYPVFFPSSAPETCSFLLSQKSKQWKQFETLLSCLAEGKLPMSAFPSYIARLNWSELTQVIEVYALLQQVEAEQQLPVQTALKLLDGEFSDEKVRSFAVRVLETLPDDRLENFLLQLTQALKFEPCHDNSLSRLLLKRALKNKRIGHFFFWYLKCEMYNPLFTPRFAVLLEAYLKGCGEAMLKRFESQLEMQTQLEEIGKQVEKNGNNEASKMQAILQDLLKQHDITSKVITPVYNPRIALGKLNPSKCKIMASKKKPQWLEMRNVDPSALRPTPTRLILKLGDDLRQDVIVLRMLSLFEKLWEKEGLPDLCLIPYGCMATGPNSGFIEVVKNARTIADVSGINDNKKLFEWIKSHQKNEFGEDDPDLLKEAVKRFTHSCAGYTVASYVLGIGDRHNDNVMITKSGNLFHIDFGHFLGNIKYFLGVKREWAPFVLTPDFVYVMGGETSDTFNMYKNLCSRAFLCLRRHNELIFNLFSLMRSTGIPELACVEDAQYIRDALMLTSSEHDAQQAFQQLIKKCLDLQWTVQIMWWIHKKRGGGNSS